MKKNKKFDLKFSILMPFRQKYKLIFIIILLSLFFFQGVRMALEASPTNDEPGHITAGYAYLKKGDLRFNVGAPLLLNSFSAFPLIFLKLPEISLSNFWGEAYVHGVARDFFLSSKMPVDLVFFLARLPILFLGVFLGIFIFKWTRKLYGEKTALLALLFFAFEPNLIAHASLATSDLGATFFIFASVYYLWCYLKEKRGFYLLPMIFFFIAAQLSKITSLILFPLFFFLIFFKKKEIKFSFKILFILIFTTWLSINLFYGFRGLGKNLDYYLKEDRAIAFRGIDLTSLENKILLKNMPLLVSYHYLKSLGWVIYRSKFGQPAFLNGQYSTTGWWYYFPEVLLIKTPLPLLIFGIFSLIILVRNRYKKDFADELFLVLPILFVFFPSLLNHINAGIRYILPIFPFFIVFSARGICFLEKKNKLIFILLIIWLLVGTIRISPYYLAYFNELVGGPKNGYLYLADSNIDWGQDVKNLVNFVKKNKIEKIKINLFGVALPETYGLKYEWFGPSWLKEEKEKQLSCEPKEGWIAISVTQLQGVYLENKDCFSWLKNKKPYAQIGYSIFVYKI